MTPECPECWPLSWRYQKKSRCWGHGDDLLHYQHLEFDVSENVQERVQKIALVLNANCY